MSIPDTTALDIAGAFQLFDGSADTAQAILADKGQPFLAVVPILWQGQHLLNDTEETPERELHAVNSIASCKQAGAHI